MPSLPVLKARGLFTNPNPYSEVPEGSQSIADNVEIQRDGIIQQRRGQNPLSVGFGSGFPSKMYFYRGSLIVATTDNKLWGWTQAGGWVLLDNLATPIDPNTARLNFIEHQGNLYYTTASGVRKITGVTSQTGQVSGLAKPVDFQYNVINSKAVANAIVTGSGIGGTGFLPANSSCGYRGIFVRKDINNLSVFSPPTQRMIVRNGTMPGCTISFSAGTANLLVQQVSGTFSDFLPALALTVGDTVNITVTSGDVSYNGIQTITASTSSSISWAQGGSPGSATATLDFRTRPTTLTVTMSYFVLAGDLFQLYRTQSQTVNYLVDPGDEAQLVYQRTISAADITAGSFTVPNDIQPDAIRGAALYTNPSQGGLVSACEPPPLCKDLTLFRSSVFFSNTISRQRFQFQIVSISIGGGIGLQTGDTIRLGNFLLTGTDTNNGGTLTTTGQFVIYATNNYTTPVQIEKTTRSLVAAINAYSNGAFGNTQVQAFYTSGPNDPPGLVLIEARGVGVISDLSIANVVTDGFAISTNRPAAFQQVISITTPIVWSSATRTGNTVTVTTGSAHGLAVGNFVNVYSAAGFTADNNFPLGLRTVSSIGSGTIYSYTDQLNTGSVTWVGTNTSQTLVATTSISANDAAANRIFISNPGQPECAPVQQFVDVGSKLSNIIRILPLRESMFLLKDLDGVWRLTGDDPSTFVVRQFDPTIKVLAPDSVVSLGNQIHFLTNQGVVQLSDAGASIISRPIETTLFALRALSQSKYSNLSFGVAYESDHKYILGVMSGSGDTTATQMFVYNLFTRAWTRWPTSATAGVVDPTLDILYFGIPATSNVTQERKTYTAADFQDAAGISIPTNIQWNVQFGDNPGLVKQFAEAEFLFGVPTFSTATVGFTSELDTTEDTLALAGFLTSTFPRNIRVYVSRNKQVCTLLQVRFAHNVAAEQWNLRGLVLTYDGTTSERAAR